MAVTLTNADAALKSYYLDAVSEQLNLTNPLLSRIKQSTNDVWGKEVKKLATYGLNGGIGAGTEDGTLPTSSGNNYGVMTSTLKNLYGTIEISDKAIRASENNSGAFVNLLNAEMEGLIKASRFNFGRMLFGDGTGTLAQVENINNGIFSVTDVRGLAEGMVIDFRDSEGELIPGATGRKITLLDRKTKLFKVGGTTLTISTVPNESLITVQGSYNNEITGLGAIFKTSGSIYGLSRNVYPFLTAYTKSSVGSLTETILQTAIDSVEETAGSPINFIVCSWGVRRALQSLFATNNRNVDTMNLEGGFKAMSYNGIPIVADRFCPSNTMYLLNTDDFTLHQLCDWQWLEDDGGRVLKQVAGKPVYSATLVKYAELICSRPCGQGMLTGITEA